MSQIHYIEAKRRSSLHQPSVATLRLLRDLINEIMRYRGGGPSWEERRRTDEKGGQHMREFRDRVHPCICISFLEHLMIQESGVVTNIIMF